MASKLHERWRSRPSPASSLGCCRRPPGASSCRTVTAPIIVIVLGLGPAPLIPRWLLALGALLTLAWLAGLVAWATPRMPSTA